MTGEWLLRLRPDGGAERPAPASYPATIDEAEADLGSGPVAWAVETAIGAVERSERQTPDVAAGLAREHTARRSSEACALAILRGLRHDLPPGRFQVPEEATEGNRELVHRGVPLDRILRAVWTSHVHTYERLLASLRLLLDPGQWPRESERITRLSFGYVDELTSAFTTHYSAERDSWLTSLSAARRRLVDDVLAGRHVDRAAASRTLGLHLGHHHVAAVLWWEPDGPQDSGSGSLYRLTTALVHASKASHSLVLPTGASEVWAWLSWPHRPPEDLAALVREETGAAQGVCVALGPRGQGEEGFRHSHLAAREAERLGRVMPHREAHEGVYDYADLAVLSLLTSEPERAERFMRETLGPLAGPDPRLAEIRETLRLYLAHGRSRTAAAAELFVARNTVAYRVKRAEHLLGRPIPRDHLPLRLALEIGRVIAP